MTEKRPESEEVVQQIRTEAPQAPFGQDEPNPNVVSDATADEKGPGETIYPGRGGYADGRDPGKDMPLIPSVGDTQDNPRTHNAEPGEALDDDM